ncbi:MAG TPA: glutamate-5-semialdehyde dehydrogenase, partial [Flavobacterium sp.]|nr:glutamate-5-semialdehyde dehydrogenase [Flavobacterium sp.]
GYKNLSQAFKDRLSLNLNDLDKITKKIRDMQKIKSGLGEVIDKIQNSDGLILHKVRVPLGVLLVVYESRPEVTVEVAALCIKSGNALILKGGSDARYTNKELYGCILAALEKAKIPKEAVCAVENRENVKKILEKNDIVDLVIARGGYDMVKSITNISKIPVLAHAAGGARIFIDKSANLKMAEKIIMNSKLSKPAACNSLDTIVLSKSIAGKFLPHIVPLLESKKVRVLGDLEARKIFKMKAAKRKDWDKEFLGLTLSIKTVKNAKEASEFINLHGKKHSEGIVARDKKTIKYFTGVIDSAAVFVNCSPRLHDGYVFGLGAEMGIATGKLHARGPVGLKELTTYKWEVY